jgi:hypothetical protein
MMAIDPSGCVCSPQKRGNWMISGITVPIGLALSGRSRSSLPAPFLKLDQNSTTGSPLSYVGYSIVFPIVLQDTY